MNTLGTGAAQLDILFQINSARTIIFDFGIDVSSWSFEFYIKTNKGARVKAISLTNGSGISIVTYSTSEVQVSLSTSNANLDEGEYYYELRRTDTSVPIVNGNAVFSYDAPQGTDQTQSLSFSYSAATVSLDVFSVTSLLPSQSGNSGKFLKTNGSTASWSDLSTVQTLTDGATVNWDISNGDYAKITLGGNRTIANPTNTVNGGFYILEVIQDATGSRTLSWGSNFVWYNGTAPTLQTAANSHDFISFICSNGKLYGNPAAAGGGSASWGSIIGTLSSQTDLRNELAPGGLLTFTQSVSNPTLPGAGEASLVMVGSTCYAWIRNVGGTTISLKTATNALLDNWSASTPCTGLPASVLFPTVFQYNNTFYMFIRKNTPLNQIFLYSSTDGIAWTALNGGSAVITGSSTATDWSNQLFNVGCVMVGTTIHILVEGAASSGTYNFPAWGGYASAPISNPVFTLTSTPQVFNVQCPDLHYAPEKNALYAIHTEWTPKSNPPSNYYGQARIVVADATKDLTQTETWQKTSLFFPEIETINSLNLAADFSIVFTPGKTYPMMMFYNYAQSTGYQAYSKTISSEDQLYRSLGTLENQKMRPNYGAITLGKGGAGLYRVDAYDANFPCIHVSHAASVGTSNDYGGYMDSAGSSNLILSAGAVFEKGGSVFRGKLNGSGCILYMNAGNIDFYIDTVFLGTTYTPTSRMRVSTTGVYAGGATTPHSTLQTGGSMAYAYVAKTVTYTLTINDYAVEATSGTFTLTLPTAVGIAGREYFITNSGAGVVTVGTTSSQTFANVTATPTTLTLNQFQGVVVISNGTNWLKKSNF